MYKDFKSQLYVLRQRKVGDKKTAIRVPISLSDFRTVVYTYFEIKFEELFRFGLERDIEMPLISGVFCFRKYVQNRSYHVIKDNEESFKQGRLVKKRIPILEDYFTKVLWQRRKNGFGTLRIKFAPGIRAKKRQLQKEVGFDKFKIAEK